jgi:hypothetical protein
LEVPGPHFFDLECPLRVSCVPKGLVPKAAMSQVGTLRGEVIMKGMTSSVDSPTDGPIVEWIDPLID